jgi:hypothetical protein
MINKLLALTSVFVLIICNDELTAQISFSEIMYDVATNEYHDEYVEIFNLSDTDSVDASGWFFSDSSDSDQILTQRGGSKIAPRSYALILDRSYFGNSLTYELIIPDTVCIFTISDNSFGKNGLSNSVAEHLSITDSMGNILSDYRYSIGNRPGFSDEKIDLDGPNDSDNWKECRHEGGTPGWRNSVSPLPVDFGLTSSSLIFPTVIFANESVRMTLQINEYGLDTLTDSLLIIIFSDRNNDQIYQPADLLIFEDYRHVSAHMIDFEWHDVPAGRHDIVIRILHPLDLNEENDSIVTVLDVINRHASLHINEIKFLTLPGEPEWVELLNYGEEEIYLNGWSIADKSDTISIETSLYLQPYEYLIISNDTLINFYEIFNAKLIILKKFPNLNDQGDVISLIDPAGGWKERITYQDHWLEHEEFRYPSLERINPLLFENSPQNWGPSVDKDGATPGRENSIFSNLSPRNSQILASPNPFSPDADGMDDVTIITGSLSLHSARIKAHIFDIKGRLIRTLEENRFSGNNFHLVWDGKDEAGIISRMGIYIIFVQYLNDREGVMQELKTTVILAQKL